MDSNSRTRLVTNLEFMARMARHSALRALPLLLVADVGVRALLVRHHSSGVTSLAFGVGGGVTRLQGTTSHSASQRQSSSLLKMQDVNVLMMRCKLGSHACLPARCSPNVLAFTLHSRRGMLAATVCGALVGQQQVVTASELRVGARDRATAHPVCVSAHTRTHPLTYHTRTHARAHTQQALALGKPPVEFTDRCRLHPVHTKDECAQTQTPSLQYVHARYA